MQCVRSSYLSKPDDRTPQIPIDRSGDTEPFSARDFVPWRFSDAFRSPTNNIWSGQRGLDPDPAKAAALLGQLRNYPYSQKDNPTTVSKHIQPEGRKWAGQQPGGLAYWAVVARMVNEEPPLEPDRITLATLVPLGIEKGKPFNPDERQKKILEEATDVGELMARANGYAKRFPGSIVWPGKHWEYSLFLKETNQEAPDYTQLDERASCFYEAVGVTVGMMGRTVGAGQVYSNRRRRGRRLARRRQELYAACPQGCAGRSILVLYGL